MFAELLLVVVVNVLNTTGWNRRLSCVCVCMCVCGGAAKEAVRAVAMRHHCLQGLLAHVGVVTQTHTHAKARRHTLLLLLVCVCVCGTAARCLAAGLRGRRVCVRVSVLHVATPARIALAHHVDTEEQQVEQWCARGRWFFSGQPPFLCVEGWR